MKPPPTLDGARVLWWAWAGEVPFGQLGFDPVFGFAVCEYDTGHLYRFTCDREWRVVQDMDHGDEESAKEDIPPQYDASRVVWRRFDD